MLAYARALGVTYYAQNYASIIRQPLRPMQIIDFVRARVAAGGELGAKVACRVPLKIDQMAGR